MRRAVGQKFRAERPLWVESGHTDRYQGKDMSDLTTEAIAFRAAGLWAIGVVTLAALNAYSYRPSRGQQRDSLWLVISGLFAKLAILMGPAGLALIVGGATNQWSGAAATAATVATILAGYLASLVLVQCAQNMACLFIGAPTQPISLWRHKPRSRRTPRNS